MDQKSEIRSYIKCRIRLNIDSSDSFQPEKESSKVVVFFFF